MSNNANMQGQQFWKSFGLVFLPFTLVFIASCFFRSVNAVLIPTMERTLHLDTASIGFVTSTFFIAFALFQVPLGILLDRYGSRSVQGILMLITSFGLGWYGYANSIMQMAIAHALIGIGLSGGLMVALKAIIQHFPKQNHATLNAIVMMSGGVGIFLATGPAQKLTQYYGWQESNYLFAMITLVIAALIYALVPKNKNALQQGSLAAQVQGLMAIYRDSFFWSITPLIVISLSSFLAIQGLWIESFLRDAYHLNQIDINSCLEIMALAMTASLFSTAYIVKWARQRNISLKRVLEVNTIIFIMVEAGFLLKMQTNLYLLWFLYGFVSQIYNICYLMLSEHYPATHSGRANAALNILTFSSVFLIQWGIGEVLSHFKSDFIYSKIWLVLIALQILSLCWHLFANYRSNTNSNDAVLVKQAVH